VDYSGISEHALSGEALVINLGQILDNNNAHEIAGVVSRARQRGFKYIILDMKGLEFLSPAGAGCILGHVEIFRKAGGDVVLCNVSPTILDVLMTLDPSESLIIMADGRDAAAYFGIEV
jgi:stage II sporulation protein AA (anti-sigma F factor antagonist)